MLIFGLIIALIAIFTVPVKADIVQDYQRDIDNYRALYNEYDIKHKEFLQFHTFTAEEDLVKTAQAMLLARADVWISYWLMLSEHIQPETTLKPDGVAKLQNFYSTEILWLSQHKERLASLKKRESLMQEAAALNQKNDQYVAYASLGTSLLYIGRLQGVTRHIIRLNEMLTQRVQSQTFPESVKSSKIRGLQVNNERLHRVDNQLSTLEQEYATNDLIGSETIDRIKSKLEPAAAEIRQLRQVLAELAEEVEW